jgi:hypothetical protein
MLWMLLVLLGGNPAFAQDAPSPSDRIAFVDTAISDIKGSIGSIEKLLSQAGDDKDFSECLKQKLAPMRILLDISEQSKLTMQKAVASGNTGQADLEMRKVDVARSKVREFLDQAYACIPANGHAIVDVNVTGPSEGVPEIEDDSISHIDRFVLPPGTPF